MSPLTVTDRLRQRFNLLDESVDGKNSIDNELINTIIFWPKLGTLLSIDTIGVPDQKYIYEEIVDILSKNKFKCEEIIKIISVYVGGTIWEGWEPLQKLNFVKNIIVNNEIQQQKEEEEKRAPSQFPFSFSNYNISEN